MTTTQKIRAQGRVLSVGEFEAVQALIDGNPLWSRHRIMTELCEQWDWRTPKGCLKTFACRSMLLTLEQRHGLRLPRLQAEKRPHHPWSQGPACSEDLPTAALAGPLATLQPLRWQLAAPGTSLRARAVAYLRAHHYLGLSRPVGSHLMYLVQDRLERDLAVHLVGAPAWQCAARDRFIGWDGVQRAAQLQRVANHSRFLVLPWVRVARLASQLLGGLRRRVAQDWEQHHGHRLVLLESFVEAPRYTGTVYRADNWVCVGRTRGRTRQDKTRRAVAPLKTVWLHALRSDFRSELGLHLPGEVA